MELLKMPLQQSKKDIYLKTVPHAGGFNNHTGSKITSSKEKVTPMLEIAKSKKLYVLDSRTSKYS